MPSLAIPRVRYWLVGLVAILALTLTLSVAPPASAQRSSVITREDCERGRIVRRGVRLSRAECLRLVGQRVRFAQSGFETWLVVGGGLLLLTGAAVFYRRRRVLVARVQ
jgi:LPXTG-motif cell wall-anchored protein